MITTKLSTIIFVQLALTGYTVLEMMNSDFAPSNKLFPHDPSATKESIREAHQWRSRFLPIAFLLYTKATRPAFGKQDERAKLVINVGSCLIYLIALSMFSPWIHVDDAFVPNEKWCFAWVSTLLNFGTLAYHATTPHHPKFKLTASARFWIGLHIASGVVEWLAGMIAMLPWCWGGASSYPQMKETAAFIMALTAIFGHVSSSFRQADGVQGSKLAMVLIYRLCISLHCLSACQLLLRPHSDLWLTNTVILFNTYVWVRVWMFLAIRLDSFPEARYTTCLLLAYTTTVTPVLGMLTPVWLMLGLYFNFFVVKTLIVTSKQEYMALVRERKREGFRDPQLYESVRHLQRMSGKDKRPSIVLSKGQDDADVTAFYNLFVARGGSLPSKVLFTLLGSGELPESVTNGLHDRISFEQFKENFWPMKDVELRCRAVVACHSCLSDRAKARFAFDLVVDHGRRGGIVDNQTKDMRMSREDLILLMQEWNIPEEDSASVYDKARQESKLADEDGEDGGYLNFDDFFEGMPLLWHFIYDEVTAGIADAYCPCKKHAGEACIQVLPTYRS